jgi:hypothetical protein
MAIFETAITISVRHPEWARAAASLLPEGFDDSEEHKQLTTEIADEIVTNIPISLQGRSTNG